MNFNAFQGQKSTIESWSVAMPNNEATARIKINRLLEAAGWRFFAEGGKPANIRLEPNVNISKSDLDRLGDNFEGAQSGFVDFLLLDGRERPLIVLEAKSEDKNPLIGKEQARRYARSLNCRFVILSNGNLHYFWDLERGNPHTITALPTPDSGSRYREVTPNPKRLVSESVDDDYIVLTQHPGYANEAAWHNEAERGDFINIHGLRFLRAYQKRAVHALQDAVKNGIDRFLFEMATGTGKTLVSAAVIKLFLRTGNAKRVLFLVDRLELEDQANRVFAKLLANDFTTVIYKERRGDWHYAEIVVTTVQSLLFKNKYQDLFSPTDFDLVISDEAHRSINGNARAVFDYFVGYKLGLTATPRDYLRDTGNASDPRETERRLLRDTYRTFGCESGEPTYRYSLLDGAHDGVLINPLVVDARTEVTTQLLSDQGFVVSFIDEETGDQQDAAYRLRDFERRFFSDQTNRVFCKTFLDGALRDPISGEIGKSIIFTVSQHHAACLANILNEIAHEKFPGRYQSNFAVQVTSQVPDAQQFAVQFANNNLLGRANFLPEYRTSKARACVTVGMMTTGYDCPDLLNIGLFRPIFSPTDFIQIKGRGTRPHNFLDQLRDNRPRVDCGPTNKTTFKLFDFFANCEYFETEFDYDQKIDLPTLHSCTPDTDPSPGDLEPNPPPGTYTYTGDDNLHEMHATSIGPGGMRIDRMFFDRFSDAVRNNQFIADAIENGRWDIAVNHINREIFDKPEEYYNLDKLRRAADVDRRITVREILEKIFELIPRFKSKDELLEEEFNKFIADCVPLQANVDLAAAIPAIRHYFKAYATSNNFRDIIDSSNINALATNPSFSTSDFRAVPQDFRDIIPEYIKDYVSLNQFAP